MPPNAACANGRRRFVKRGAQVAEGVLRRLTPVRAMSVDLMANRSGCMACVVPCRDRVVDTVRERWGWGLLAVVSGLPSPIRHPGKPPKWA